jgi:hypothetical protein
MIFLFSRRAYPVRRGLSYRRVRRESGKKTENIYQEKKQKKLQLENQIDDMRVYKENPEIVKASG